MNEPETQGLGDVVTIAAGIPTARTTKGAGVPVRSVASLIQGIEPTIFADQDDIFDMHALMSQPGDVIVALEGPRLGESFAVPDGFPVFVPSQQAVTLRVLNPSAVLPAYLAAWAGSSHANLHLRSFARGTTRPRIAVGDLPLLKVPIPSIAAQANIAERVKTFDEAITAHRRALDRLTLGREVELEWLLTAPSESESR